MAYIERTSNRDRRCLGREPTMTAEAQIMEKEPPAEAPSPKYLRIASSTRKLPSQERSGLGWPVKPNFFNTPAASSELRKLTGYLLTLGTPFISPCGSIGFCLPG